MVPKMHVTAYSVNEDWVQGEYRKTYTYSNPNNNGQPWIAKFSGCCRNSNLMNNKDASFSLTALVDLSLANKSPRAHSLPVITVPINNPRMYIPSDDNTDTAVSWHVATPWEVGNAASFDGNSYMSMSLAPHHDVAYGTNAQWCDNSAPNNPACFFQALRTAALPAAVTLEGWVRSNREAGGYILSTGRGPDAETARNTFSSLAIQVNHTHVTVGHEVKGVFVYPDRHERTFAVCSNVRLAEDDVCTLGMTRRWVHIAVIRYHNPLTTEQNAVGLKVSYKVMVNGETLEMVRYPVRPREQLYASLGGNEHEVGETDLLDAPVKGQNVAAFGRTLHLIFGGFRGGDTTKDGYFVGMMDEWRVWNGARTVSELRSRMHSPIKLEKQQYYGDPSATKDVSRSGNAYKINSVLFASWTFDVTCPAMDPTCPMTPVRPEYPAPADPRVPAGVDYTMVMNGAMKAGPTDNTGVMFYSEGGGVSVSGEGEVQLAASEPGLYQVLILLAFADSRLHVPVDFIVDVLPTSSCTGTACQIRCGFETRFVPEISMFAPVVLDPRYGGVAQHHALYVGESVGADALVAADAFAPILYPGSLRTFAGFPLHAEIQGIANTPSNLPPEQAMLTKIGFSVGALRAGERMQLSAVSGQNPSSMSVSWLPCRQDLGNHTLCADAVDLIGEGVPTCRRSAASVQACLRLLVEEDPAPRFLTGEGETPTERQEVLMGRPVAMDIAAVDDNCMDSVVMMLDPETQPAGAGLAGPEEHVVAESPCMGVKQRLLWTPQHSQGGMDREVCVLATDGGGSCRDSGPKTTKHCVHVTVRRCEYALLFDQQLQEIAGAFGTDWMRLWSLNPQLQHPDYVVFGGEGSSVMVGHLMTVAAGETGEGVARRMGMPLDQLQMLNYDIDVHQPLVAGATMCVIPNSCQGLAGNSYAQDYKDPAFARDPSRGA